MKFIILTNGHKAIVDDEDYDHLKQYNWYAFKPYKITYAVRKGKRGERLTVRMHRQIMQVTKNQTIDHINGNGLDNRKINLRLCDASTNQANMRSTYNKKTSEYKGVSWNRNEKSWVSQIQYQKRKFFLGYYKSEKEAAIAYNAAARVLFGEFAHLNKI
jgi:hypothetical protein